jgi:FAD/FMN-containing dehydrogenase
VAKYWGLTERVLALEKSMREMGERIDRLEGFAAPAGCSGVPGEDSESSSGPASIVGRPGGLPGEVPMRPILRVEGNSLVMDATGAKVCEIAKGMDPETVRDLVEAPLLRERLEEVKRDSDYLRAWISAAAPLVGHRSNCASRFKKNARAPHRGCDCGHTEFVRKFILREDDGAGS